MPSHEVQLGTGTRISSSLHEHAASDGDQLTSTQSMPCALHALAAASAVGNKGQIKLLGPWDLEGELPQIPGPLKRLPPGERFLSHSACHSQAGRCWLGCLMCVPTQSSPLHAIKQTLTKLHPAAWVAWMGLEHGVLSTRQLFPGRACIEHVPPGSIRCVELAGTLTTSLPG